MINLTKLTASQHCQLQQLFALAAPYYNKYKPSGTSVNRAELLKKAQPIIDKIRSAEHDAQLRDFIANHMVPEVVYELIRQHDFSISGFDINQHEFKNIVDGDPDSRNEHVSKMNVDSRFSDEEKAELKSLLSKEVINIRIKFGMDRVNFTILDKTGNRAEGTLNPMFEHYLSAIGYKPCVGGNCSAPSYEYGAVLDFKANKTKDGFFICYRHFPSWVQGKEEYELLDYENFLKLRNERFDLVAKADAEKKNTIANASNTENPNKEIKRANQRFVSMLNMVNSKYGDRINFFTPDFLLHKTDGGKLAVEISGIRDNQQQQTSYNNQNNADKPKIYGLAGIEYQIYKSDQVWVMYQWGLQKDPSGINKVDNRKNVNTAYRSIMLRAFGRCM